MWYNASFPNRKDIKRTLRTQINTHNSGVYALTNVVTGRQYIGSSKNLESRYRSHLSALSRGRHTNKPLQSDFSSNNDLQFEVLQFADVGELKEIEQLYLTHQTLAICTTLRRTQMVVR